MIRNPLMVNWTVKKTRQIPEMNQKSFSYKVNVAHLSAKPLLVTLEADDKERQSLAQRWGVSSVEAVAAKLEVSRWKRDGVRVKGSVEARITQSCVVTLDPVISQIFETIEALFVPEGSRLARVETSDIGEMIVDAEGPDAPETYQGDTIDLAEICEEFIVLSIDPYPRLEGAEMPPELNRSSAEEERESPFAGLSGFKTVK